MLPNQHPDRPRCLPPLHLTVININTVIIINAPTLVFSSLHNIRCTMDRMVVSNLLPASTSTAPPTPSHASNRSLRLSLHIVTRSRPNDTRFSLLVSNARARAAFGAYTLLLVVVNALPVICIYCFRDPAAAPPLSSADVIESCSSLALDGICHVDVALAAAAVAGMVVTAVANPEESRTSS
jgi:hypothetical protein